MKSEHHNSAKTTFRCCFCRDFLCQLFKCRGEHELDPVELVDLTGSGIVVDGDDVGAGVLMAQLLDNALSDDMVRQAAEGLCTDDIVDAGVDQLDHFAGQKPAFSGLVPDGNDGASVFGDFPDRNRSAEMFAPFKLMDRASSEPVDGPDSEGTDPGGGFS